MSLSACRPVTALCRSLLQVHARFPAVCDSFGAHILGGTDCDDLIVVPREVQ